MDLTFFSALMLAICGLYAGWLKCLADAPRPNSRVGKIPVIGGHLSRINIAGWVLLLLILTFTLLNISASNRAQEQLDGRLAELREATSKIQDTSAAQVRTLSKSIDRLDNLKSGVEAIEKQAEELRRVASDTASNLKEGNREFAGKQKELSDSLSSLTLNLKDANSHLATAQQNLIDTLGKINGSLDQQFAAVQASESKALDQLNNSISVSESSRKILNNYINDERALADAATSQESQIQFLEAETLILNSGASAKSIKTALGGMSKILTMILQFDTDDKPNSDIISHLNDQMFQQIPDNNWQIPKSVVDTCTNLLNAERLQYRQIYLLQVIRIEQARLRATMPTSTAPATQPPQNLRHQWMPRPVLLRDPAIRMLSPLGSPS